MSSHVSFFMDKPSVIRYNIGMIQSLVASEQYLVSKRKMKSVKRKAIAQNLKLKYIVLSIDFHLSYLVHNIAKIKRKKTELKM